MILGQTEQTAFAANKLLALGEMTGGVIHDFRNILAIIDVSLAMAEAKIGNPEEARIFLLAARGGVERGARAISQLLTFAKKRAIDPSATDINEQIRTLSLFLGYGVGTDVQVCLDLADDLPNCWLDEAQFSAALLNLVANSRDAMPNGGEVVISTRLLKIEGPSSAPCLGPPRPGTYVRVRVKDSGTGMSTESLKRVFDPFFTTKGEQGTGLGVPQVYAFMQLIDGGMSVDSAPGAGTTVDLFFRVATTDQ